MPGHTHPSRAPTSSCDDASGRTGGAFNAPASIPTARAITCDFYLRGQPSAAWGTAAAAAETGLANIENNCAAPYQGQGQAVVIDRLQLPQRHLRLECVQFFDVTDRRNTLVTSRRASCLTGTRLPGNLLLVRDALADRGLFILKEAPCSDAQLAWPGCDFISKIGEVQVAGVGLEPVNLDPDAWTRGYGCVVGVATGGEYDLLSALRSYQEQIRIHQPGRDEMILLETRGATGDKTRASGKRLRWPSWRPPARLGITHFQLNNGWQAGQSSNSAFAGGSLENIWTRSDYWAPHPDRFPNGLGSVVERSKALGIELCLWFTPERTAATPTGATTPTR